MQDLPLHLMFFQPLLLRSDTEERGQGNSVICILEIFVDVLVRSSVQIKNEWEEYENIIKFSGGVRG